jgi:hypothetical protein
MIAKGLLGRAVLLAATTTVTAACGGGSQGNAQQPQQDPTVQVSMVRLLEGSKLDVTPSAKLKEMKIQKVIVTFPRGAAEITNRSEIERFVRKALLKKGVELVVGEVRARVEKDKALQARKEQLSEAEKLIVLGKETGADAILVFDEIHAGTLAYDVQLQWNEAQKLFDAMPRTAAGRPASCPRGFRVEIPTFTARGRMVGAAEATILAEFDVRETFFIEGEQLKQPASLKQYELQQAPPEKPGGPTRMVPVDVSCQSTQRFLGSHVPRKQDAWRMMEGEVATAMSRVVDGIMTP